MHTTSQDAICQVLDTIRAVEVVDKPGDEDARDLAHAMRDWLKSRGVAVRCWTNQLGSNSRSRSVEPQFKSDLVIVIGGDGTFLSVARQLPQPSPAILGFNLGKVGFLTELCPGAWREALAQVLEVGVTVHQRMALGWMIRRGGSPVAAGKAVNELVISRGNVAKLAVLDIAVQDERLGALRCDGLMASTPSGSTGYAVSAGGPLIHPDVDAYCLTPICPFLDTFYPLVLPCTRRTEVTLLPCRSEVWLTIDGQEGWPLQTGDTVQIEGLPRALRFATLQGSNYLQRLKVKGFLHRNTDPGLAWQEYGCEAAAPIPPTCHDPRDPHE